MKPTALYQGGAPATFSQMGQGVAEGIGKVGELYARGIGNVSNAITSVIDDYAQKQQVNKSADALQKFANTLPAEEGSVGQALQTYMSDPSVSNLDKVKFGQSVVGDYFKNMMELRRIQEMNKGRLDLQGMRGQGGTAPVRFNQYDLRTDDTDRSNNEPNFSELNAGGLDLRPPTYGIGMPS